MIASATIQNRFRLKHPMSSATTIGDMIFPLDTEAESFGASSDHVLLRATCAGSEAAFAEIVSRYRNPITGYVYRLLNDYETSVDIAQETFVRVYQARERYTTDYAFSTYIYRIATNLAISEMRRRKRRTFVSITNFFLARDQQPEHETTYALDIADTQPLQDSCVIERERQRAVQRAIASLPEMYRVPLVLRDIENKPYDEIAVLLEMNLGTTKSRISRARAMLKDKLAAYL